MMLKQLPIAMNYNSLPNNCSPYIPSQFVLKKNRTHPHILTIRYITPSCELVSPVCFLSLVLFVNLLFCKFLRFDCFSPPCLFPFIFHVSIKNDKGQTSDERMQKPTHQLHTTTDHVKSSSSVFSFCYCCALDLHIRFSLVFISPSNLSVLVLVCTC